MAMKVGSRLTRMAGTACIGKISEFESVSSYVERVEFFFSANDVPAAKHMPVLLSVISGKMYNLLQNLLAPAALKDKSSDSPEKPF